MRGGRPDEERGIVIIALIAFGVQDWLGAMEARRDFSS